MGGAKPMRAVTGVDLSLARARSWRSSANPAAGKSVTLRALMRLLPKRANIGGRIIIDGRNVMDLTAA